MQGRAFLDTNIIIYFFSTQDEIKRKRAYEILNNYDCVSSTQVMNESCNVWLKKFAMSAERIHGFLDSVEMVCEEVLPIHREAIDSALSLKESYGFSYYDCLMLASALEGDCTTIFTEDMSDGQIINETLKIENPFV